MGQRVGRNGGVGEGRALGPPGDRSPAARVSLPASQHRPAPHLAPLARGRSSRCAGRAEVAMQLTRCYTARRCRQRARFQDGSEGVWRARPGGVEASATAVPPR